MIIEEAEDLLEGYAARGVFRGFSRCASPRTGEVTFKMLWHRDRNFELTVNVRRNTVNIPVVLPEVPAQSAMYRELRQFVQARQTTKLPEHRRIDPRKARVHCGNRARNIGITITAVDRDMKYAIRKLIALVHEIYMVFLYDGRYYDYVVEVFDLDPDRM